MELGLRSRSVTARTGCCVLCDSVRCVILCDDNDICILWGFYCSSVRTFGTTYRAYLQGPRIPRRMVTYPVKMGPMGCSETSLQSYHILLRKIPKCADLNQISKCVTSCRSWLWQLTVAVWLEHSCWHLRTVKIRIGVFCINRTMCHTRTACDADALWRPIHT